MKHANVAVFIPHLGCPHDCSFCNQRKISGSITSPTVEEIRTTAEKAINDLGEKAEDAEFAFFGGSFTAIDRDQMENYLKAAKPYIGGKGFKGIRISTRPDAIDDKILALLRIYGVTAIELGAQSMDDNVLRMNNRGHSAEDVVRSSRLIKEAGFALGLQMMTGLYGDSDDGAKKTAEKLSSLGPETIRIYPTIVIRGTALEKLYKDGKYRAQELPEAVELCAFLLRFFEQKGIKVIRLGLHASESLQNNYVSGPWHPAFRELCESRLYLEEAEKQISKMPDLSSGIKLLVGKTDISKMTGQHRSNITKLEEKFHAKIVVEGAEHLEKYEVLCKTCNMSSNFETKNRQSNH